MADFPLTPDQAKALQTKGMLSPETASRFEPLPEQTAPMPEQEAVPLPSEPANLSGLNDFIAEGEYDKTEREAQARAEALEEKRLRAQQMRDELKQKVSRSMGPQEKTPGFLGVPVSSLTEGRELSAEQVRSRYIDEYQKLQALEDEIKNEEQMIGLASSSDEGGIRTAEYNPETDRPDAYLTDGMPGSVQMGDSTFGGGYDAYKSAYDQKIEAVDRAGKIGEEQAAMESNYLRKAAEEEQQRFAEDQAKIQEGINQATEALAKLDEKALEVSKMKAEPKDYWADKSTGEKVLAGIALFLGAAGGVVGKGNTAARAIQREIEKDLERQRYDIESERRGISQQSGVYRKMLDAYGDSQMALNASRSAYFMGVENDIAAMSARYKGQESRAKADMMIADLQAQRAQEEEQLKNRAIQLANFSSGNVNPMMLDEKQQTKFVRGMGIAYDKESAKLMREAASTTSIGVEKIKRLLKIADKPMKSLSLDDRAEATTLSKMLQGMLRKEIVGPGAVSESEWKLLNAIIANPTAVFSLDSRNKMALKTLGKSLQKNLAEKAKMYIMQPTNAYQSGGSGPRTMRRDEYKANAMKAGYNAK